MAMGRKVSNSFNHNAPFHEEYNSLYLSRPEPWRMDTNSMFDIGNFEGLEHPHEASLSEFYRHEASDDYLPPLRIPEELYSAEMPSIDIDQFDEIPMDGEEL